MPSLMPTGKQQYFYTGTSKPLAGGKVYTYAATTSTPKATYQDAAGTIPNTNPIVLDSTGSALIFWTGSYKVVVVDAAGNTIYTVDNYVTDQAAALQSQFAQPSGASLVGFIQAGAGATKILVQDQLREWVTPQQYGAKADGATDDVAAIEQALATGKAVDFGDVTKVYFVSRAPRYTGRVEVRATGATIKGDCKALWITDGSGSRVRGLKIIPATTPYTITRNPNTWAASAVTQSSDGYMPTSQDTDIWPTLPSYVQAQFDNFDPRGIYFDVSSAAGGRDVEISGITGYQCTITLAGYTDSSVKDCDFGGRREGVYFYNALGAPNGAFTLPRGVNNAVINTRVRYASQCGIAFFGNDRFKVDCVWSHDNGESGVKTYQHDPATPTAVMCTDGVFNNVHTYNNFYDGLDATNVNGIDSPGTYESRHTLSAVYSSFNRHTGITICGQKNKVSGCNVQNNGSHGLNGQGVYSSFSNNYAAYNAAHPEIHPFQIFDICIQGDGHSSVGNKVYNPNAPSTWNYIHTGLFGADPTATNEGSDIGNRCSHGEGRMLVSQTIPAGDSVLFGSGSRALTNSARGVFRQGGGGADVGGSANIGYVRIRGDSAASANLDFTPNSVDPAGSPGFAGRLLYDFTNNLFRMAVNGGAQSAYLQAGVGHFGSPDNALSSGAAMLRWTQVFAATSAISTSDERYKDEIGAINDPVLRAWARVDWRQYKFRDAVEEKGTGARWHFGAVAQQVKAAFEAEGLDPFAYGLLCYDKWEDKFIDHPTEYQHPGQVDADGKPIPHLDEQGQPIVVRAAWRELIVAAGDRYGIRYEEALALECAYLRSRLIGA